MTDLGKITRQGPTERVQTLNKFANRLNNNDKIREELESWNLAFSKELVKVLLISLEVVPSLTSFFQFRSRILEPEQILGDKGSKATYQEDNADWGSAFRKWNQISVGSVSKWAVIHNPKYILVLSFLLQTTCVKGRSLYQGVCLQPEEGRAQPRDGVRQPEGLPTRRQQTSVLRQCSQPGRSNLGTFCFFSRYSLLGN